MWTRPDCRQNAQRRGLRDASSVATSCVPPRSNDPLAAQCCPIFCTAYGAELSLEPDTAPEILLDNLAKQIRRQNSVAIRQGQERILRPRVSPRGEICPARPGRGDPYLAAVPLRS